jgi:hypothetical protein
MVGGLQHYWASKSAASHHKGLARTKYRVALYVMRRIKAALDQHAPPNAEKILLPTA